MNEYKKNQLIHLENGLNFIIIEHATYKNENYFFVARLSNDCTEVLPEFTFLHEIINNNIINFELVDDPNMLQLLYNIIPKKG